MINLGIKVKYKNKEYDYEKEVTLNEVAKDFQKDFENPIIAGSINNRLSRMDHPLTKDCTVGFFDINSPQGNKAYERGLLFVFTKAVKDILNCDIRVINIMENGIYCEVLSNNLISEVTVEKIKIRMKEITDSNIPITKIMVSRTDAIDYFEKINQADKAESLKYISNSTISLYKLDDMLDYYYGVVPNNTNLINEYNLKFINNNRLMIIYPYMYTKDKTLKYEKNELLIKTINNNTDYLESLKLNNSIELNSLISTGNYDDLIRLSESIQNNRLFEIANNISSDKDVKVVLISGPSSSGKTTTSRKLTLYLRSKGYEPIPVSVDDFYIDYDKRVLGEDGTPEKEKIDAIDTKLFNETISELLNGKEVKLPIYNFITGKQEVSSKITKMNDKSILIVEGIHAFNEKLTEMIPDKNKYKIFICSLTPLNVDNHNLFKESDNRLLRRIIRDNKTRNLNTSETLKLWKSVRKSEEESVFPFMKNADAIFNTSLLYELNVLKTYAEPLLFSVNRDDENYDEAIRLINLFRVILGIPSDNVPNDSILKEFIGGSCFKD